MHQYPYCPSLSWKLNLPLHFPNAVNSSWNRHFPFPPTSFTVFFSDTVGFLCFFFLFFNSLQLTYCSWFSMVLWLECGIHRWHSKHQEMPVFLQVLVLHQLLVALKETWLTYQKDYRQSLHKFCDKCEIHSTLLCQIDRPLIASIQGSQVSKSLLILAFVSQWFVSPHFFVHEADQGK